jgi:hypothetical protein
MIPSPSESYWIACGRPAVEGIDALPPHSVCAACGYPATHGMPMRKWSGADSLVADKIRAGGSPYACRGCVWSCTWAAPPGRTAKEGQSRGPAPSMYAHCLEWTPDGPRYANASKGEKPVIRAWLSAAREHPWWIVVADMGKKQLIPWAEWSLASRTSGSVVFLDDEPCTVGDLALIDAMMHLLTVGATKATLETGDYTPNEWARCTADLLAFERDHGHHRGSSWFRLALWLAQRDEEAVAARMEEEKTAREAKKAAEKEAQKRARDASKPTAPKPPATTSKPKKKPPAAPDPTPTTTPPTTQVEPPHEAQGRTEGTATHADRGVPVGHAPAGTPERLERPGPVGPGDQPDARRRTHQRRPRRVDERHDAQPQDHEPQQGQLGLFA